MNDGTYACTLMSVVIIVPTLIILMIAYIYHKLTNDALAEFAGRAGLLFNPGNFLGMTDIQPSVTGKYKDLDFCLTFFYVISGKHRITNTSIVMHLPHLCILNTFTVRSLYYNSGFGTYFSTAPEGNLPYEKPKTGDVEFDESFSITAAPALIPVFTPELREKLLSIRDQVNIEVCDKYITFKSCAVRNVNFLINLAETMHYMAHKIRDVTSNPGKAIEEKYEAESSSLTPGKERSNYKGNMASQILFNQTHNKKSYEVESDFTCCSSETVSEGGEEKICPSCKANVSPNNFYCPECGRKI